MTWRCAQTNTLFLSTDISILSLAKKLNYDKHTKKTCLLSTAYPPRKKKPYCWLRCVCVYVCGLSSATFSHQVGHKPLPLAPSNALALYVMPGLSAGIQRSWKPFFLTFRPAIRSHNCHFLYHAKKKKANDLSSKIHQRKCGALNCFAKVSPFRCRFNVFSYYYLYQSLCYALLTSSHLKPIGKMFLPRIKTSKECQFL